MEFGECEPKDLSTVCPNLCSEGVDLLEKMLQYDPSKRISPSLALEHKYFKDEPLPCDISNLPIGNLVEHKMKAINDLIK